MTYDAETVQAFADAACDDVSAHDRNAVPPQDTHQEVRDRVDVDATTV